LLREAEQVGLGPLTVLIWRLDDRRADPPDSQNKPTLFTAQKKVYRIPVTVRIYFGT
jgi:hypothetical protein